MSTRVFKHAFVAYLNASVGGRVVQFEAVREGTATRTARAETVRALIEVALEAGASFDSESLAKLMTDDLKAAALSVQLGTSYTNVSVDLGGTNGTVHVHTSNLSHYIPADRFTLLEAA